MVWSEHILTYCYEKLPCAAVPLLLVLLVPALLAQSGGESAAAATASAVPAITGLAASFLGQTGISSNSYLEIYGTNLAQTTRPWTERDFTGVVGPKSLDGVRVLLNGKPATLAYISPGQVNVIAPDDTALGAASVVVQNAAGTSNLATATRSPVSPALHSNPAFMASGKQHVVAQTADFRSFIGPAGMLPGFTFTAAKGGDRVVIFALGCGPTTPAVPAGTIAAARSLLHLPYKVLIGGVAATVEYAGSAVGAVGLFQFNVTIPNVAAGDQPIELQVDGVSNRQNLVIHIGQTAGQPPQPPSAGQVFSSGTMQFRYPDTWRVVASNSTYVKLEPINAPQQLQFVYLRWGKYGTQCAISSSWEQFYIWLSLDGNWFAPQLVSAETEFPSGRALTFIHKSRDGLGDIYTTSICRDAFVVDSATATYPRDAATVAARHFILSTLIFGEPVSLTGGPWQWVFDNSVAIRFMPDGAAYWETSSRNSVQICNGSYQRQGNTIDFSWRCPAPPPPSGRCTLDLSNIRMSLSCSDRKYEFIPSVR